MVIRDCSTSGVFVEMVRDLDEHRWHGGSMDETVVSVGGRKVIAMLIGCLCEESRLTHVIDETRHKDVVSDGPQVR